jgi:hypothetical protein
MGASPKKAALRAAFAFYRFDGVMEFAKGKLRNY